MAAKVAEERNNKDRERNANTEEVALQDVRDALIKLREALPKLTRFLGGSITDLVGKLQNCLPDQPSRSHSARRNQRRYHTVGVTPEEVAKAKEWIKQKNCEKQELVRMKLDVIDYKAGCFMEPAPQVGVLSYIELPSLDNESRISLEPPILPNQDSVSPIADISAEVPFLMDIPLPRDSLLNIPNKEHIHQVSSSDDESLTPGKYCKQRSTHVKRKVKRSNTLEVPRLTNNCEDSQDELMYCSDQSESRRNTPNYSLNKSDDHDSNKGDDVQKYHSSSSQEDNQSKVHTYNPSARGGKHWSNRFSRIKTAFEELSSDEKEMVLPSQKTQMEKKLPWNDYPKNVVTVFSPTPPTPVSSNQFTHAPLSRFKPVEKKNSTAFFPSSVSGTVKQLASQKFSQAKSEPQLNVEKPLSFTQRTLAKFRPKKSKQPVVQVTPVIEKYKYYSYDALTQPKQEYISKGHHKDYQNYTPKNYSKAYSDQKNISVSKPQENFSYPSNNYTFNFDYDGVQARFQGIPTHVNNNDSQINNTMINPFYRSGHLDGQQYNSSFSPMTRDNEDNNNKYIPVNKDNLYQINIPASNVYYNNTSSLLRTQDKGTSPSYGRQFYDNNFPDGKTNILQKSPSAHEYFFPRDGQKEEDFSDMEYIDKLPVGRIMGEAQKRNVAVINPLVRSLSGLLPPKKPMTGLSLSKSPNTLKKSEKFMNAPNQPKILHKSESCHQLVAQYLPPVNSGIKGHSGLRPPTVRRNSDHNPKSGLSKNPSNVHQLKQLVLESSCDILSNPSVTTDDLDNVDEAFESIFKESNVNHNCK